MKKQKIIALSAIACFVCAGAGIFALSGSADTNVSEKTYATNMRCSAKYIRPKTV